MRPDAYGIVTAYGSPHLARKAEQVPQGLGDIESSKRTCPLCSIIEWNSDEKGEYIRKGSVSWNVSKNTEEKDVAKWKEKGNTGVFFCAAWGLICL